MEKFVPFNHAGFIAGASGVIFKECSSRRFILRRLEFRSDVQTQIDP